MDDIDKEVESSKLSSFADGTNLSRSINNAQDVDLLQEDLNKVYNLANKNNMVFNDSKFELLRCGDQQDLISTTFLTASEGLEIEARARVKCLGVHLSADASFQQHIRETI